MNKSKNSKKRYSKRYSKRSKKRYSKKRYSKKRYSKKRYSKKRYGGINSTFEQRSEAVNYILNQIDQNNLSLKAAINDAITEDNFEHFDHEDWDIIESNVKYIRDAEIV